MIDTSDTWLEMRSDPTGDAALVPLPDSPNESLVHQEPAVTALAAAASGSTEQSIKHEAVEGQAPALSSALQSPHRKVSTEHKPMSPEKAALAAMFDSIKMPPPTSPSKSPRKASGSNILSSPSKRHSRDVGTAPTTLFLKTSSPPTSPSKVGSSDSAASRPHTRDSPLRRPVIISSSSSPGKALRMTEGESKNASTPLSPPSARESRPARMRPSILASSSSPSAKLSDLTLNFDTTGTQELLFNQDASFLAAAGNAAADVTIDDSFDVSRAKARIRSASAVTASTRRSSPAKIGGGYKAKPRCSMVPEDGVPEIKPSSPGKRSNALGSRGLGVGRVVKNAAGDDTIELNLTGSFIANSSMIGGNLMDESGEASLLFGNNSFSISQTKSPKKEADKQAGKKAARRGGSDDDDDDDEEEEDFERDAKNVQRWAAEAARKAQLERHAVDKTPSRATISSRSGSSTVTRPTAASTTVTKPVSRIGSRPSLATPTAGSRLLQPRSSGVASTIRVEPALTRSGSASSGLSSTSTAPTSSSQPDSSDLPNEAKTPMRSRRKSTFTSSRPPVSGARRRDSLAAAGVVVQPQPIPPLPSLGPATPGRTRTTSTPGAGTSPGLKTPTAATTRTIPKPRTSLTGRTSAVNATSRASAPVFASTAGSVPRPRTSLTSSTAATAARSSLSASTATATRTPGGRTATSRSASLATPTARTATSRSSLAPVEATPVAGGMRKSISQPQGLDLDPTETPVTVRPASTLVPRASMTRIGSVGSSASSRTSALVTPRATDGRVAAALGDRRTYGNVATSGNSAVGKVGVPAARRPSVTGGGFGFKPRASAVYVGATRAGSLLDEGDKENQN
ncbi:hypothetical protein PHBOTO_001225 [Pseudozyma hubeiensis]|nr:hypothetical protein PHBOTO_001225 [Pseudozyma hubeiensis]